MTQTDPKTGERGRGPGLVGEPETVNPEVLHSIMKSETIPVIAPIGVGRRGETFNINATRWRARSKLRAEGRAPVLLTDVEGVLDQDKKLIPKLSVREARALIANGTIFRRHDSQDPDRDRTRWKRRPMPQ